MNAAYSGIYAGEAAQRVDGDAQLGFPAGGDALHAPFDFIDGDQQAAAFVEQQRGRRE